MTAAHFARTCCLHCAYTHVWHLMISSRVRPLTDVQLPEYLPGNLPGAAAPDWNNPMWPSGLADRMIREEAHLWFPDSLEVVLGRIYSAGVNSFLVQLVPSVVNSFGKEKKTSNVQFAVSFRNFRSVTPSSWVGGNLEESAEWRIGNNPLYILNIYSRSARFRRSIFPADGHYLQQYSLSNCSPVSASGPWRRCLKCDASHGTATTSTV